MKNYYLKTTKNVLIQKPLSGIVEAVALGKIEGVGISLNFDNEIVNYSYSYVDGNSVKILVSDTFQINGAETMQAYYDMIASGVTIDANDDFSGYLAQVHYSLFKLKMYETFKVNNPTLTLDDFEIIAE